MGAKNWRTDREWFKERHLLYKFTIDAAADHTNHLLSRYMSTRGLNYLGPDGYKLVEYPRGAFGYPHWATERAFCNPPYDYSLYSWLELAVKSGGLWLLLLPVSTDTAWFHDFVWDDRKQAWRDGVAGELPRGRHHFGDPNFLGRDGPRAPNLLVTVRPDLLWAHSAT